MAGEARKAAARKWYAIHLKDMSLTEREAADANPSSRREHIATMLASYEAETIEQCAQIADKAQAKSEEEVREFRRLKLSGCAMQSQSEMSAFRTVAAAIRSIAQQDSANEGGEK